MAIAFKHTTSEFGESFTTEHGLSNVELIEAALQRNQGLIDVLKGENHVHLTVFDIGEFLAPKSAYSGTKAAMDVLVGTRRGSDTSWNPIVERLNNPIESVTTLLSGRNVTRDLDTMPYGIMSASGAIEDNYQINQYYSDIRKKSNIQEVTSFSDAAKKAADASYPEEDTGRPVNHIVSLSSFDLLRTQALRNNLLAGIALELPWEQETTVVISGYVDIDVDNEEPIPNIIDANVADDYPYKTIVLRVKDKRVIAARVDSAWKDATCEPDQKQPATIITPLPLMDGDKPDHYAWDQLELAGWKVGSSLAQGKTAVVHLSDVTAAISRVEDAGKLSRLKGRDIEKKPISLLVSDYDAIKPIVDFKKLREVFVETFGDSMKHLSKGDLWEIVKATEGITFARLPIVNIPKQVEHYLPLNTLAIDEDGNPCLQVFTFRGDPAETLQSGIFRSMTLEQNHIYGNGNAYYSNIMAITSANLTGQPQIPRGSKEHMQELCQGLNAEYGVLPTKRTETGEMESAIDIGDGSWAILDFSRGRINHQRTGGLHPKLIDERVVFPAVRTALEFVAQEKNIQIPALKIKNLGIGESGASMAIDNPLDIEIKGNKEAQHSIDYIVNEILAYHKVQFDEKKIMWGEVKMDPQTRRTVEPMPVNQIPSTILDILTAEGIDPSEITTYCTDAKDKPEWGQHIVFINGKERMFRMITREEVEMRAIGLYALGNEARLSHYEKKKIKSNYDRRKERLRIIDALSDTLLSTSIVLGIVGNSKAKQRTFHQIMQNFRTQARDRVME